MRDPEPALDAKSEGDAAADALEFDVELAEPPEKVWRALTVPDLLAAWIMPNDIRPEIGERFSFAAAGIECEILDAEPGRLLRYSWRQRPEDGGQPEPLDSVVTFTLVRTVSGGTHLRIVHDGFAGAVPAVAMAGAGCRLAFGLHKRRRPVAANMQNSLLRAA